MVKIVLTNHNEASPYKTAIWDSSTKNCLVNDEKTFDIKTLKLLDFSHPLFTETPLKSSDNHYLYHYDNREQLFQAPRLIYATILQAENSENYCFEIHPKKSFNPLKTIYKIPFSLNAQKTAEEEIRVHQLNRISSDFYGFNFQFVDTLFIKDRFALKDLPTTVDGDLLYKSCHKRIEDLLNAADDFSQFEIRYINRTIGFGLFARKTIYQGEPVLLYNGRKELSPKNFSYYFRPEEDSLNLGINSREYGNAARFINHASNEASSEWLSANLESSGYNVYGLEIIALIAQRQIEPGEQLLFDYSKDYFKRRNHLYFNSQGQLLNSKGKGIKDSFAERRAILTLCAKQGVKQAVQKIVVRSLFILLFIFLLIIGINYLD